MSDNETKTSGMDQDPVVKALRDFIKQCPYLPEFYKGINVDFQGSDIGEYMIESTPADPWVKRYVNGTGIKRFPFNFSSRELYTEDVLENINNSGFFEFFSEWLEECTRKGVLPELEGNKKSIKIFATTSAYLYDAENGKAQYIIQCNLHYFQY